MIISCRECEYFFGAIGKRKISEKKAVDKITNWDLPDTHMEPDGYEMREVPDPTGRNIEFLINKINELIDEINELKNN